MWHMLRQWKIFQFICFRPHSRSIHLSVIKLINFLCTNIPVSVTDFLFWLRKWSVFLMLSLSCKHCWISKKLYAYACIENLYSHRNYIIYWCTISYSFHQCFCINERDKLKSVSLSCFFISFKFKFNSATW